MVVYGFVLKDIKPGCMLCDEMTDLIIYIYDGRTGHQEPHDVGHGPLVAGAVHTEDPQVERDVVQRDGEDLAESVPQGGDPLHHGPLVTSSLLQQLPHLLGEDQDCPLHTASCEVPATRCPAG